MKLRTLSALLDPLPFPARHRVLVDTARSLAGSAELTALLVELDARPGVTRRWAMLMATVAGDDDYLRRRLTSPDVMVSSIAVHYCVHHGRHFDVVAATLPTASTAWRQALYRALRARRATTWATGLLPTVRAHLGDREAAAVLPACDAGTVRELLPELDFAVPNVAALARCHPDVVLDHVRRRLTEAGEVGRPRCRTGVT
jgi:hypothetical protein